MRVAPPSLKNPSVKFNRFSSPGLEAGKVRYVVASRGAVCTLQLAKSQESPYASWQYTSKWQLLDTLNSLQVRLSACGQWQHARKTHLTSHRCLLIGVHEGRCDSTYAGLQS